MSIFTKVPGIYRTRAGGYVYVKFIAEGLTDYPVVGCKAYLLENGSVQWEPNYMQAYTREGRCFIGKDQVDDIVAYDADRVVLIFRPVKGTPPPADIDKLVLFRHPKLPDGVVEYQYWPYKAWMDAGEHAVEWAELP